MISESVHRVSYSDGLKLEMSRQFAGPAVRPFRIPANSLVENPEADHEQASAPLRGGYFMPRNSLGRFAALELQYSPLIVIIRRDVAVWMVLARS